jgi:hypothetical protein
MQQDSEIQYYHQIKLHYYLFLLWLTEMVALLNESGGFSFWSSCEQRARCNSRIVRVEMRWTSHEARRAQQLQWGACIYWVLRKRYGLCKPRCQARDCQYYESDGLRLHNLWASLHTVLFRNTISCLQWRIMIRHRGKKVPIAEQIFWS